jgi:hypothetical protein
LTAVVDGTPTYALSAVCDITRRLREWRRAQPVVVGVSTRPKRILGGVQ